ncbi:NADPH dehydrogenase NamA [Oceanobacillus halophilus]|uniref:NADPH dehydrogenase NamA n=1 Tax=Oceanobacillus halophilus TaxID=930130 RepID=A0A495ACM5_9BACI|nr:NADPH dehydrogenase NamA [Oceanobacillus halophilus]RKQ37727.1 NADPH dehydrogenase NamA [Oceanobacillus halophilus]
MAKLFSPYHIKNVTLKNRVVMSPMCMYSSSNEDGMLTPFHLTHYTSRALGQVGLIITEATAVQPEGRISLQDLGIWSNNHIEGFKQLNNQIHSYGSKSGIQLAHAGRKARLNSTSIYAPSPIPFNDKSKQPTEMTKDDIIKTIKAFKEAARRAREAQFDIIEIHAAHGYLINEFLSPLTNKRSDQYGGEREGRFLFLKEVIEAVKLEWTGPLFVRISTNEYDKSGNTFEDILYFTQQLKSLGVDLIDCSSGGVIETSINTYPGYQLNRCERIKNDTDINTGAVGLITSGLQAEEILQNDRANLVFIGRALLRNPYWAKAAAEELREEIEIPKQYKRGWK